MSPTSIVSGHQEHELDHSAGNASGPPRRGFGGAAGDVAGVPSRAWARSLFFQPFGGGHGTPHRSSVFLLCGPRSISLTVGLWVIWFSGLSRSWGLSQVVDLG